VAGLLTFCGFAPSRTRIWYNSIVLLVEISLGGAFLPRAVYKRTNFDFSKKVLTGKT
jgi:hypothetical protein